MLPKCQSNRLRHWVVDDCKSDLLFPLTNSVCRSSWACWRFFSRLFDDGLADCSGFTKISSRIKLRRIPDLVKPPIIMTSCHNTCRNNSFDVAVARRFTLNEVNVSNVALIIQTTKLTFGTNSVESTSCCYFYYSFFVLFYLFSIITFLAFQLKNISSSRRINDRKVFSFYTCAVFNICFLISQRVHLLLVCKFLRLIFFALRTQTTISREKYLALKVSFISSALGCFGTLFHFT